MKITLSSVLKIAFVFSTGFFSSAALHAESTFAVVGDVPYGDKALAQFPLLVRSIEDAAPDFLIHLGDIKAGSAPCTDEMLSSRIQAIDDIQLPVIFIPGDNDWTDCHRRRAGRYSPLERLEFLRRIAYPEVGQSLGTKSITLESQAAQQSWSDFPEHQFWKNGSTSFVALHVLGSDNGFSGFKSRGDADDAEVIRRIGASISWLEDAFAKAKDSEALVVAVHGNPFGMSPRRAKKYPVGPYAGFLETLRRGAALFAKPVLLIHGDTHDYKFDQPMKTPDGETVPNIYRLEGIGSPDIGWVEVSIGAADSEPFSVQPTFITK